MEICACKGVRSCYKCENDPVTQNRIEKSSRAMRDLPVIIQNLSQSELEKLGAYVFDNFLTEEEEEMLKKEMDKREWVNSQSGRRKQDFGPKANFKKKKAKLGTFVGIPEIMFPFFERIREIHPHLKDYNPVECLFLEYDPENGAHIDPHFDDDWLWAHEFEIF